jgi:hypothetical protein
MKTKQSAGLSGVWAVTWRSFVYMPLAVALFMVLLCLFMAIFVAPILGIMFLVCGLRWPGATSIGVFLIAVWSWRYFRVGRLLSGPGPGWDHI